MSDSQIQSLLQVQNLSISFGETKALQGVSFDLGKKEILGIVGESGSGKSLTSLAVMGLLPSAAQIGNGSSIKFFPENQEIQLLNLENKEFEKLRGARMGMIFQEPMTSLNPSITCGDQVAEALQLHKKLSKSQAKEKVLDLFEEVQLPNPERIFNSYPHQLSGGQRQRVMIAMAISCEPVLLIADEPTTALDVSVQKSILNLLRKLHVERGMSIIFISHDLGVISELCDRVLVMKRGQLVEKGQTRTIFNNPKENYTRGLIACRPKLDVRYKPLPTVQDFMVNDAFEANVYTKKERSDFHNKIYQNPPLLEVKNLKKYFTTSPQSFFGKPGQVKAVDNVSFSLYPGETLGLVGESGSGKTTLSRTLLLLEKPTAGEILYRGKSLTKLNKRELKALRREIQIIFQDPYSSLNPRQKVAELIMEPMKVHHIGDSKKMRRDKAAELLEKVGLHADDLNKYPHQFSGGQRQRIGIARVLGLNPEFIICDESVSALDVSVQAMVLNLLNDLKEEFGFSYIFISHDLSVVKYMSDQLLVMQQGKLMESGDADEVYAHPKTNYTKELIQAIPKI